MSASNGLRLCVGAALLAGAVSTARSATGTAGEEMARFAFELGAEARLGELRDEALLYGCAELPGCALGCRETLLRIGDRREHEAPACAGLPSEGRDRRGDARAFVRARLANAGRGAASLAAPHRDALECGLGRLALGPQRPDACAREEARVLARALESTPAGPHAEEILIGICAELEACSGRCGSDVRASAVVGFESVDRAALARDLAGVGCPELAGLVRDGPAPGTRQRVAAWALGRLRGFAGTACPGLDPEHRAKIICGLGRVGADPVASCGTAKCVPAPPRRFPGGTRAGP